jgi:hypothetical protein
MRVLKRGEGWRSRSADIPVGSDGRLPSGLDVMRSIHLFRLAADKNVRAPVSLPKVLKIF